MSNIKAQTNNIQILQKFILDPLSTIIKLAVLGKKEIGCKISIKNNQIFIQEYGIFQGVARYYLGVTKNDIHYLSIPIELACKRYLTNDNIKKNLNIIIIFKSAQQGLNKLMETYVAYPIIVHCLKYYYSIIDKYLHLISCDNLPEDNKNIKQITYNDKQQSKPIKIPNKNKNKESKSQSESPNEYHTPILNNEFLSDTVSIDSKELTEETRLIIKNSSSEINNNSDEINNEEIDISLLYSDDILTKFELIWENSKIQIIIDMINYLSGEKSAYQYAGCIETFMIPIDKEMIKIINDNISIPLP